MVEALSKIWKQSNEHKARQCSEFCRCLNILDHIPVYEIRTSLSVNQNAKLILNCPQTLLNDVRRS